jgi:hypothetical protein
MQQIERSFDRSCYPSLISNPREPSPGSDSLDTQQTIKRRDK